MDYEHGVYVSEVPTSVISSVNVDSAIPVIVGTAPVNMGNLTNVNKAGLYYSYAEAVAACGFVPAKEDADSGLKKFEYSISEALYVQFALYGVSPVIVVNVLDPKKHKKTAETSTVTFDGKTGTAIVKETGILLDSVKLDSGSFVNETDYILSFNADGNLVITSLTDASGAFKIEADKAVSFEAEKLDPSAVTVNDIIGGIDTDGNKTGLEVLGEIDPRFNVVPGFILAPGFSDNSGVAAVMAAKAESLNGQYRCTALIDVNTETVKQYTDAVAWKSTNNITGKSQRLLYGLLALNKTVFHQSCHYAVLSGKVDGDNDGVPVETASNKAYQMDSIVRENGAEIWLDQEQANYLNGNGIITALNGGSSGWTCWGWQTAAYPGNTDVKDADSAVRRMFDWLGNTLSKTYRQKVDKPTNRRQIDTVVESVNIFLSGLVGDGKLLGARVEFREDENPTTELLAGKTTFHLYITPSPTNGAIKFRKEFDTTYIATLFS